VLWAISKEKVYGPFFFVKITITGNSYLDMLTIWRLPQLEEDSNDFIFQQDGAPPHFHMAVRNHLNAHLPQRWIGRAGANNAVRCRWPPRSPDLTPYDFFFWGYIQDKVFVPLLPWSLPELRQRTTTVIASITRDTMHKVWDELDYRLDICRVTHRTHIESRWGVYKSLRIFLSTVVGVKFYVRRICFLYHFESVKLFCAHPVSSSIYA
jgi:hypothetical protein